jgi:hypothetical protein
MGHGPNQAKAHAVIELLSELTCVGFTVNSTGTQVTVAAPAGVASTVNITVLVGGMKTAASAVN